MKICLNMIVKNEAKRIERALASAFPYVDSYVIVDTGSADDTVAVIEEYARLHKVPGIVTHAPFVDWSQARNAALRAARENPLAPEWDVLLLMDADMELKVENLALWVSALQKCGDLSMDMEQRAGSLHYQNRRLVGRKATGVYKGVTHEYLDVHSAGAVPTTAAYFVDHADGANRPEKYKRDIRLLREGLKKEPKNERYYFYLAQSYRDAGDTRNAMKWYKKRVEAGGWDEERWNAQLNYAHCFKDLKDEGGFIREALVAYNMRPSRAETLYDLAHYFRHTEGRQATGAVFAEAGMTIPRSNDALFVNDYVYNVGCKEEFSITGFYVPHRKAAAYAVTDELSQATNVPENTREGARQNLFHYIQPLKELAPSFKWQMVPFGPPDDWVALNPSVTVHGNEMMCVVRTVNYRIDEWGRYLIRGTDGTANGTNPINTRNFMVNLSDPFGNGVEIINPSDLPCEFNLVIGFEDMRLISRDGQLLTSSTVRQIHPDGNCEQVLARLDNHMAITDVHRMLRQPRTTEKNWAAIPTDPGTPLLFMHRPGTVVNTQGDTVSHNPPPGINVDNISGGSQLVPLAGGYIALVHSARQLPGSSCRYYFHRFVYYSKSYHLLAMSRPFVFHEKTIEFAAGMCIHPKDENTLVFTYGYQDKEARMGQISTDDAMRILWAR